ncbi:glycoside hydrolase family 13 protein [Tulasnella calospora MUT 4182]|uniref:Glycoside hydrolase family 13 protein n=1 Tax=Tulasnella calospora MUT 4182 TaxID=1051891 RepID=A0A0C3QRH1_9AGAM|nr:glycoside hydrolase family 13 protein [Tulasnella calospora MUT 4182]
MFAVTANEEYGPKPHNYTILQAFEWYSEGGGKHWKSLQGQISRLAEMGITALWLPPVTKAYSKDSVGYDIYDLWDLGEFDQKAARPTKYGTKEDLLALLQETNDYGLVCYIDAVLNHKFGADRTERFEAMPVRRDNRLEDIPPSRVIEGYTGFDFPGRNGKYSTMKWGYDDFTGVDHDKITGWDGIFRVMGPNKGWAWAVDSENRNYDFLMGADLDQSNPDVAKDLFDWGTWVVQETGHVGFRFDAIKHIDENFMAKFVAHIRENSGKDKLFCVGDLESLNAYLDRLGQQFSVFDTPLHYNFKEASDRGENFDLRRIWDGSLVSNRPVDAVTLVDNHDTQIGQSLQSWVQPWFKPLAYAMILLRPAGYPCVFWGDLYGCRAGNDDNIPNNPPAQPAITQLGDIIKARKLFSYGELKPENDYWDYATCVGWVRTGDQDHDGCAVVLSNGTMGGCEHAGEQWIDLLGWTPGEITVGDDGKAEFRCPSKSIAIWISKNARGCEEFTDRLN